MLTTAEALQDLFAPEPSPKGPVMLRPGRRWLCADQAVLQEALAASTPAGWEAAGPATLERLRTRGLATDDGLVGWVGRLLGVITSAHRQLEITVVDGSEALHHTAWLAPSGTVVAERGPRGSLTLESVAPDNLPATVARIVGHGPRPEPTADNNARTEVLARFTAALAGNDPAGAAEVLRSRSLHLDELRILHGVATGSIRSWRVEAVAPAGGLTGGSGEPLGRLAVLDGGSAGTWLAEGDDTELAPASASAVWRALADLVHPTPVSDPAGTVASCPSCPRWRPSAASSIPC